MRSSAFCSSPNTASRRRAASTTPTIVREHACAGSLTLCEQRLHRGGAVARPSGRAARRRSRRAPPRRRRPGRRPRSRSAAAARSRTACSRRAPRPCSGRSRRSRRRRPRRPGRRARRAFIGVEPELRGEGTLYHRLRSVRLRRRCSPAPHHLAGDSIHDRSLALALASLSRRRRLAFAGCGMMDVEGPCGRMTVPLSAQQRSAAERERAARAPARSSSTATSSSGT